MSVSEGASAGPGQGTSGHGQAARDRGAEQYCGRLARSPAVAFTRERSTQVDRADRRLGVGWTDATKALGAQRFDAEPFSGAHGCTLAMPDPSSDHAAASPRLVALRLKEDGAQSRNVGSVMLNKM